ncbi:MAG: DUF2071 domain-containing protein [Sandaracinaceae bacterium]|nr:DUF2071 domain-containing protein [Sandaracinaceae bacterium]
MRSGSSSAFVSSVSFFNTRFYVGWAPFVRLSCEQTNCRACVGRRGVRCLFFYGTHLASPFVHLPRLLWRMPWSRSRIARRVIYDTQERCQRHEWRGEAAWGKRCWSPTARASRSAPCPGSAMRRRRAWCSRIRWPAGCAAPTARSRSIRCGTHRSSCTAARWRRRASKDGSASAW